MSNGGSSNAATPDTKVVADLAAALKAAIQEIQQAAAVGDGAAKPDPRRARTARDYDVIRALLGQGGRSAPPHPLTMGRKANAVVVKDAPPAGASVAVVQAQDGVEDTVAVTAAGPQDLQLTKINDKQPIARVELLDATGQLVAFGPSLPAIP